MNPIVIVVIVVVLILFFYLLRYYLSDKNTLQKSVLSGKTSSTIQSSSLATNGTSSPATNFTYSYWFYINDWNYRYGHKKVLFGRMATQLPGGGTPTDGSGNTGSCAQQVAVATNVASSGSVGTGENLKKLQPCPAVIMGAIENNITIALACHGSPETQAATGGLQNTVLHTCTVTNIPIQRWTNLVISTYNRSLDVYLDGKLVRTCLLPGIPAVKNNANIIVTPMGGFDGWTSKLQYWPNTINPQQVWDIYRNGYQGSSLLGGDYQIQVNVMENGSTQNTYTLG
jgi:hypothetical protein